MAADAVSEPAAPNLNLSSEEKRAYGQLFRQADTDNVGVVTGEVAVKFFDKTRLNSHILGEIWQIADQENRGFLTPAGFGIVLRLIGHAQAGREPTREIALQQGPLPRFDGFGPPVPAAGVPAGIPPPPVPMSSPPPPVALQAQSTGGPIRIPPLTPEKVAQYAGLFERQGLQAGGQLPGDQAKQIFEKSGLPNEALGRIWQLADTEQRGALILTEFVIAMHLLTSMKTGALRALPSILPAGLYEAASRRPASRQASTGPGISAIPRQVSGSAQLRTGSPLGRPPMSPQGTGASPLAPPTMSPQATGASDWAVTPADKARFDQIYADLDKGNKGYITGEEAVPFLSQSNLPEDTLAQIWDLSDINSQGQLNRDQFAVAMYLIRQQRGGRSVPLPSTLPLNLVPPSFRNHVRPPTATSAFDAPPPVVQPPPPQPKSALEDLFGLDSSAPSPAPPAQPQAPMSTGGSNANDPFGAGSNVLTPSSPIRAATTGTSSFKPFVPSSSFGRGLTTTPTGGSSGSGPRQPHLASASEDLLADNDPEASRNLSGETTELANLSNQISSLSTQMQDVQAKRTTTQNELTQATSQKQNFEQRLAQLRTLYEKEAQDTRALEEQLKAARAETQKLQSECMALDGTYRDIQTQHQQVLASLQEDQKENGNLRERIRVVNGEIAQIKPQIEKLKSEARQQKGLVAINKKQLSTTEGERDKLKSEAEDLVKSNEELSRQVNASSPASASAQIASPAASTSSGNNPFFRRTASTDIMGAFASPPAKNISDKSFDDLFGPSFSGSTSGTPPPPAVFKPQNTGASSTSVGSYSTPPTSSPVISRQPTVSIDPPAPPESRQISSSFLPFVDNTESLSSSRQVSPPASRVDDPLHGPATPIPGDLAASVNSPLGISTADDAEEPESKTGNVAPVEVSREVHGDSALSPPAAATSATNTADPFGTVDEAKAKADFENAFAAFTTAKTQSKPAPEATKSTSAFDSEFPPISELERDDSDSDSASERGGFEDDFAPVSPPNKLSGETDTSEGGAMLGADDPKPIPFAPTKETAFPSDPKENTEQPASPATVTDAQRTNVDDIFGSAAEASVAPKQTVSSNPPQAKGAFDDVESDFEGLEDAKEGSGDEEFANISRSGLEDFNPVFDSSPPASQAKSESTAFGNESSFDFVSASSTGAPPASGTSAQSKAAEAHDWDAIFSGFDSGSAAATAPAPADKQTASPAQTQEEFQPDDPILKRLTSMGYERQSALDALEKYDYDVNKAANYLASHS
ncbi:hypothetical protein EDB81DRAFT_409380 [Dactylonectria macrodidyma]|uniref:Uncharacterized protein n=1 Tax=Dactylonectria macrodidyma TaxID=307937 RepID=A0A9P9F7U5_9HYPO|nr:hypothetical protein EDB81DRAFT_409380 [Dactylonectria macrodidyma]